jgi:transketolase
VTAPTAPAAATREAYPVALSELVEQGIDVVALDADLSASTMGYQFGEKYPERWHSVGIAEANMVGIGAGYAATGKTAFIASFASFLPGRCFDQIRTSVAQPKGGLNVNCVASHGGVTVGEDGASAQAIEDLALMTSLIPFDVIVPADFESARQAIIAVGKTTRPSYVRTGRPKVAAIYDRSFRFEIGRANVLRPGSDVTAEEHQTHGGLGTQVARVLAETLPTPVAFVGVDRYGTSGKWDELLGYFELTPGRLSAAAKDVIARKR